MTPIEIKIAYLEKKICFIDTARRLGVTNSLVSRVIARQAWSMAAAIAIAEDVGRAFDEVFPERMDCPDRRRRMACGGN